MIRHNVFVMILLESFYAGFTPGREIGYMDSIRMPPDTVNRELQ